MSRLLLLGTLVALAVFVVRKLMSQPRRRLRVETQIMPHCSKCESNRHVVTNIGVHPIYPRDRYHWFCQGCEEGF